MQNTNYLTIGLLDSIHDFKGEETPVPEILLQVLQQKTGLGGIDLGQFLAQFTQGNIKSLSNYERRSEAYIERINGMPSLEPENFITYQDIISDHQKSGKSLWKKYKDLKNVVDIISIGPSEFQSFAELAGNEASDLNNKQIYQNILGDFILSFLFPDDQSNPRITFDGNSGVLGKIFSDIDQMKCVITPLTIGDSATTTTNSLKGRIECVFPSMNELLKYNVSSNIFTQNDFELSYNDKGFNKYNIYQFSLDVNNKNSANNYVSIPFSSDQNQGPSISYLSELITLLQNNVNTTNIEGNTKNVLKIGRFLPSINSTKDIKQQLLFDIKRTGDYEQVNSSLNIKQKFYPNMILSTRDVLCSTYSRFVKQSCIFHNDETMTLYRFPTGKMTAEGVLLKTINDANYINTLFQKINFINGTEGDFLQKMNTQIQQLNYLTQNGCFVPQNKKNTTDHSGILLITQLERIKMFDMYTQLNAIYNNVNPVLSKGIEMSNNYLSIIQIFISTQLQLNANVIINENNEVIFNYQNQVYPISQIIQQMNAEYNHIEVVQQISKLVENTSQFKILNNLNPNTEEISFDITFYKSLANDKIFIKTKLPIFNYDYDLFLDFYSTFISLLQELMNVIQKHAVSRRAPYTISKSFEKYLEKMEKIKENMVDDNIKLLLNNVYNQQQSYFEELNNAIDSNDGSILQIIGKLGNELQNNFISQLSSSNDFLKMESITACLSLVPPTKGGQRGGSAVAQEFFDINDIFREICGMAENVLNANYSQLYPYYNIFNLIENALHNNDEGNLNDFLSSSEMAIMNLEIYSQKYSSTPSEQATIQSLQSNGINGANLLQLYNLKSNEGYTNLVSSFQNAISLLTPIIKRSRRDLQTFIQYLTQNYQQIDITYYLITAIWKVGLENIKILDVYQPNEGILIMSFLLSYTSDGFDPIDETCNEYYNKLMQRISTGKGFVQTSDDRILSVLLQIHTFMSIGIKVEIINLCILSIFNDIMNHNISYIDIFVPKPDFAVCDYESQAEWTNTLMEQLIQIITFLKAGYGLRGGNKKLRKPKTIKKLRKNKTIKKVRKNKTIKKVRKNKTIKKVRKLK